MINVNFNETSQNNNRSMLTKNSRQATVMTFMAVVSLSVSCITTPNFISTNMRIPNNSSMYAYNSGNITSYFSKEAVSTMKLHKSIQRIEQIQELEDNWNGYGAKAFSLHHLENVKRIIAVLSIQPEIFPTAQNSIQLEYEKDSGEYLEFEIFENGAIKQFSISSDGSSFLKEDISVDEIDRIVNLFNG